MKRTILAIVVTIVMVPFLVKDPKVNLLPKELTSVDKYMAENHRQSVQSFMEKIRVTNDIALTMSERTDNAIAHKIAVAVVEYSTKKGFDPWLIRSIIEVENPELAYQITNGYGATGLMQVVDSIHWGKYPECEGSNLKEIDTNICYGVNIYFDNWLRANGNDKLALWNYNGCNYSRRLSKERCLNYPDRVFSYRENFIEEIEN